jgi:hypothetical protein
MPRRARRTRRGWLSSPRAARKRSGRLQGRPGFPGRPTAPMSRVCSRRVPSAGDAASRYAPNGIPVPSTNTIHVVPLPRVVLPTRAPLFGRHETPVSTALIPAPHCLVVELPQEGPPELEQDTALFPVLEPAPAGTRATLSPRQRAPWGTGPEDPEEALHTAPILDTRASTSGCGLRLGMMDPDGCPWVHSQSPPHHVSPSLVPWPFMVLQ